MSGLFAKTSLSVCIPWFHKTVISSCSVTGLGMWEYQFIIIIIIIIIIIGVMLDSKLYFHHHVDYISSQGLKMLGLIRYITSSFSSPHSLSVLHTTLALPKLEYASVAWNSIVSTGSSKLERVRIKFATLYHSRFFCWCLWQ
jgi:uncharacterized membrane protein